MKEPSSKLSLYREKWSKTESHFTNEFVNISPLESPPEKHFMCEGGPVTKPLSNFEWEQIFCSY